jgi:hypothetical protein
MLKFDLGYLQESKFTYTNLIYAKFTLMVLLQKFLQT